MTDFAFVANEQHIVAGAPRARPWIGSWEKSGRKPAYGYKAHVATDRQGGIVRAVEVTTADVHDGAVLPAILPPHPGEVYY